MPGPWEQYQQPTQGKPWEKYAPAPPPALQGQEQPKTQTEGALNRFMTAQKRGAGLSGRMVAELVGGIPMMAADLGVGARNLIQGRDYELPSSMYRRGLDQIFPKPQGLAENAVNIGGPMIMGSRIPMPQISNPAPANFVPQSQQALQAANRSGYVIPPATARPNSYVAGTAEGAAGKISTGQRAAAMNQGVTNRLANQAIGLSDDGTLSPAVLDTIRAEAGKAHQAIRGFSQPIVSDTQYRVDHAAAIRSLQNVADKFPAMAQREILNIADNMNQPRFDADSAVDAISLLRDKASTAYRAGDKTLGGSYRALSDAFEGLIERRLEQGGAGELVQNFRDARQLIAKTYSIQRSLRVENVDAASLARALDKGKYLSGTLRQIGQFAQKFPKAARVGPATESLPPYSPLDMLAIGSSVAGGLMSNHPAAYLPAIYAAGRPAMRNFLLSPAGQSLTVNGLPAGAAPAMAGASIPAVNALARRTDSRQRQ